MADLSAAEAKKDLGNKAFAEKKYEEAISFYSEAIRLNAKNHVYFSNRSASYGFLSKWNDAASDAKACIKVNPAFLKGYYRLANAQIELNELDAAHATIKQGLNVEPNNTQLLKQLRIVNGKKKDAAKAQKSSSGASSAMSLPGGSTVGDSSISREIIDLQNQFVATTREFNTVKAHISKSQRQQKMDELTKTELDKFPQDTDSKMYRSIGKMFMLSKRTDILTHLDNSIKEEDKKASDLTQKLDYLERRLKSQRQNIEELSKNTVSSYA